MSNDATPPSDAPLPPASVQVTFTPEFKRHLRQLAKKYRRIKADLQPILDQLASGVLPGDPSKGPTNPRRADASTLAA